MTSLTLTRENLSTEWRKIEQQVSQYGTIVIQIHPTPYIQTKGYHDESRETFESMESLLTDLTQHHSHQG